MSPTTKSRPSSLTENRFLTGVLAAVSTRGTSVSEPGASAATVPTGLAGLDVTFLSIGSTPTGFQRSNQELVEFE